MTPETNDPSASFRMAGAAGALVITAFLLVALGLGFPPSTSAQSSPRAASPATDAKAPATKVAKISSPAAASIERGRYLVATSGCNDCHTAGYAENGGTTPQSEWLLGDTVGFRGPWGVSYPSNLRLTVQELSETEWLRFARAQRLPPMPWFNLRDMNDDDLRAMYHFIRSLGPRGERAPRPVAPNGTVTTPFIQFTPQVLPSVSQSAPSKPDGRG